MAKQLFFASLLLVSPLLAFDIGEQAEHDQQLLKTYAIEPTQEGLSSYLQTLQKNAKPDPRFAKFIEGLGDDSYEVREDATAALLKMNIIPVESLQVAAKSPDAEIAARALRILNSPQLARQFKRTENRPAIFAAVCRTIQRYHQLNLAPTLLQTAPEITNVDEQLAAIDAIAAIAKPENESLFRNALEDENQGVRAMALRGLISIAAEDEVASLGEFRRDKNELIALIATHAAVDRGEASALVQLATLAQSKELAIRIRSVQLLRSATGQDFELDAYSDPKKQPEKFKKWRRWLADNADKVAYETPVVIKPLVEDRLRGLLMHLPCDSNPLKDISGNKNRAVSHNDIKLASGVVGKSIEITGQGHHGNAGGYVAIEPIDFRKLEEFTIALWVYETGMSHNEGEAYISFGVDSGVGIEEAIGISHFNNDLTFRVGGGHISLPYDKSYRSKWMHYALTYSKGELCAYKNGVEVGKTKAKVAMAGTNATIGSHRWGGGAGVSTRFVGRIDDVRVYERKLTARQLLLLATP